MNEFTIRYGAFAGKHCIYANPEEARQCLGSELVIKDWETFKTPDEIQRGDWVKLTDSCVAQILRKTAFKLTPKQAAMFKYLPARYVIRFAFYSVPVWYRKKKDEWARGRCLGHPNLDSTRMAKMAKQQIGTSIKDDKIALKLAFASLILRGLSPQDASNMALKLWGSKRVTSPQQMYRFRKNLMADELVVTTIQNGIAPLKQLLDKTFTPERMASELEVLLNESKPGGENHRLNIQFIMQLTGMLPPTGAKSAKQEKMDAQDVAYTDVAPPALGK
jgi:hypothetical protein